MSLRKILITSVLLFLAAQALFLINIQFPRGHSFDEFHYVPSAKQFLSLEENRNWEHPPLGKVIMAASIAMWGDRPIGWRFLSTTFGALTLVAMYLAGLALFRSQGSALFVALLTFVNHLLYVQARIGMLDTFMFAFMAWGLAAFFGAWSSEASPRRVTALLAFAGAMFGFATACKWMAVIPLVFVIGVIVLVWIFRGWNVAFSSPSAWSQDRSDFEDFYTPALFRGFGPTHLLVCLILIPAIAYFATFIPYLFVDRGEQPPYTLLDLFRMQRKMYEGQLRVVTAHPYMSNWPSWPLMTRPIWYSFEHEGPSDQWVRGVLMLGNPLIMWSGLVALIACLWAWLARRSREAFLIVATYSALYFCWMIIPRKVSFYYYYYPAGMVLGFAIAFVFHAWERGPGFRFKWARWSYLLLATVVFLYFFPILSALKIPSDVFRKWMWLRSWI